MSSAAPLPNEIPADQFSAALQSGIHRVIAAQETLNRINVFPVADGDTGTNLSLSLGAALNTLTARDSRHVGRLLVRMADALLDGARGNSGAIVAQFFQGMSDSAQDIRHFNVTNFADAVEMGNDYAHDALEEPREGTILSVIAAYSASLKRQVSENADLQLGSALDNAIAVTGKALNYTEKQLDVLRKAGVVDAGAKGFVVLVEGMTDFIVRGTVTDRPEAVDMIIQDPEETAGEDIDLEYQFCTECMITGSDIDRRKLRERMSELGNSLVIAGTKLKAKVHIHTNHPEAVFTVARDYGVVSGQKADDMKRQQESTHNISTRFAVITDSAADIADEDLDAHDIHIVPLRIQFGDRGYLDKVSITPEIFFAELETAEVHPTTSQPSPGDFRRQYEHLASHFPDVVSVSLTPKVSGTYQAAVSAAERTGAAGRIHVVNSLNASLGQGQLAVFAAECAEAGLDVETTLRAIGEMLRRTTSFGLVRDLRYAVRGGRVPAAKKLIADLLHITPVLQTRPDGSITANGIIPGRGNLVAKFAKFIAKRVNHEADLRLAIGHALCRDDALKLQRLLTTHLPNTAKTTITDLGSAIGVHGGRGAIVAGVQEYRPPTDFL